MLRIRNPLAAANHRQHIRPRLPGPVPQPLNWPATQQVLLASAFSRRQADVAGPGAVGIDDHHGAVAALAEAAALVVSPPRTP